MKFQVHQKIITILVLMTGIFLIGGTTQANLLQNGSFEYGPNPGSWMTLEVGSTVIDDWTVY